MKLLDWFLRKKKEIVEPISEPPKARISDYYFSVEAREYRYTIDELTRQLRNEQKARVEAEKIARILVKNTHAHGRHNQAAIHARKELEKLVEILKANEVSDSDSAAS